MKDRQEVGISTVIAVVVLIGLIVIAASAGVCFLYSNFPWATAVAHPLLRVSVVQLEPENKVEVVIDHVGGDVIDVSKVTVKVRGEKEDGDEIELDSDRDNAVKVTPNGSELLQVAERMRVVFENHRLKVGSRVEVMVIYAHTHVMIHVHTHVKSSATFQPSVPSLPILILSLTDPDIDVMETVWRPRLERNEYPRILGYNVHSILAVVTVELGNSTCWVPLIDNEVLDLVHLMKRMNQSSFTFQPGVYDRIRVEISRVTLITADNKILEPLIEETTLEFPVYLQLMAGKRHELRVDVDAPSSLRFTRENELVWNTRVRISHRVLVDDEWSEVVIRGEENVTRIIDGEVAESYPVNPTVPPLDVRCSTHYALIGEEVEFSFEPSENVVEVSWDFDDGENSTELSPRHAFFKPGGYEVRVTAKYADDTIREGRVALAVTHPAPAVREESVPPPVASSLLTDVCQFTGQPAVQVPLKVPPGRMVEPSLSLVYGGGHQNGMLGVGWTLEGLGSIERDTREGAPSYDNSDKFVITHGGEAQELVSLGEPSHPPQGFTWTVIGTGQEKVGENGVIYPEIGFDWNVHAQGIERGMWREEFPDVPFNWTVEGKATETWQEEVCHVDPVQQVTMTILANKIEEWSSGYVDHGGANWIPNAGSTISGVHGNIGTFEIPSGYTVYVGGSLEVHAQRIVIRGVLCANGRGYGGARCEACCGEGPGKGCGYWGDHGYGWGGGGAGYGGVGGKGNGIPGSGGRGSAYGSAELISWPPSSNDINMGSGGGAGTAAQGGFDAVGGNGGGKILLMSSGDILISGTISANGNNGGYGSGRGEGGGGGGSGGGILLWGDRVTVTGSLQAKGGNGGNSWESGGGGGGAGGRIKVFYRTSASVRHVDVSGGIGGYREIWGRGTWADGGNGASGTYRTVQLGGEWASVHEEVLEVNLLEIYDSGLDMGELASMLPYPYGGTPTSRYWYEVRSNNPNLIVYFSDTSGSRTVNPSAHVIIKPVEGIVTTETLTEEVTASSSSSATVNMLENWKDLGGFSITLQPQHGGTLSAPSYTVNCDEPRVQVRFSDTRSNETSDASAHVQAKTDYYEFNWYPGDYTAIENDSSGHAIVSALSENDLGVVMPPLIPQHEGTIENVVYTASCDDSRVTLSFSDTGTNQTSNSSARLIASTDYCISTHVPENQVQVSASCSGTGSVSASDGEKDLGGFEATPEPKHGGVVENVVYSITCDNPRVEIYFSDTGTTTTTNPNAHVVARTDYQEPALVSEYRPRNSNNSRVKFNGEYWELWSASGTRYTFGSSSDSRMVSAEGTFRWLLDRVTDVHGNYMTISYVQDGGYAYPASIEYTGHESTGEPPWVRIEFVYEDRPDPVTSYRAGSEIVVSKRLNKIEMRVGGELIRTYELGYSLSPTTQRSLLSSITERAGTGEALPSVTFEYSQGAWTFDGETTEEVYLCEHVKNGDFGQGLSNWTVSSHGVDRSVEKNHLKFSTSHQGGGRSGSGHTWGAEFSQSLGYLEAGMSATLSYAGYLYQRTEEGSGGVDQSVILVRPDGSQVTLDSRSIPHSDDADWDEQYNVSKDISSHITQSGEYKLIIRLSNGWAWGDRGGGWCYIQVGFYSVSVEAWHPGSFRVSDGGGLMLLDLNRDAKADLLTITRNGDWLARVDGRIFNWLHFKPLASEQLLFGDFNGDGKLDAGIYSAQNVVRVAISTGEGFNAPVHWSTGLEGSGEKLIAGDFNGDGKTDVLAVKANGLAVALSAGDRFVSAGPWLEGVNTDGLEVLAADFNADHLTDIALVDKSSGTWQVALSTGRRFTSPAVWISGFSSGSVAAMDLNRDGLSDAVAFSSGELRFARSTGRSFVSPQLFMSGLERMPALADFNADGLPDLSVFNPDTCVHRVTLSTGEPADRLIVARNELGGEVSYTYLPSTSFGVELPTVVQVVEKTIRDDGVGDPSTTTYAYEDGEFQVGQGFVGFGTSSATLADSTTTTRFHLDTFRKGLAYETQVSDGDGNLYFKKHVTWELREPVTGTKISLMTREDTYTYDGDENYKLSATLYEYDNYGNLVKVQNLGDLAVEGDERTTCIEYAYNLERWIMAPSHTWILDADNTKAAETWYYYDGATSHASSPLKGDLTKKESWLDTGDNPVTKMSYDVYGNLISTTDARGNTTTTEYDLTRHLFPVRVTNPLGHAQTSAHDLATGQLLSQTDFNGVTTSYEYDGFGRLLKVIGPGDTPANPTKSFTYDLSSRPAKTVVQTRSTHGASQTSIAYVFFDGFGRVVQTRHQAEDTGQQVVECWGFNQLGKVEHEWLPYLAPTSSSYSPSDPSKPKIRYEYDVTGRVVKMTYPDGTSVTSAHSDWTTTTTDAKGNSIRKTYDAYGRLVKIEEFNLGDVYTTTYSYDAMGNLVQIVDAKGNITTMTYDTLGRRISLDDPDMGKWLYWYDANGNLTGERDAKGEMISYTYDALNRLVRKSYPSGQDVEYEYDSPTVPYSIGRRTTVIDASGSTTFYYDELGREIKTVKSIDGTDYVIERSFDSAGRLTSVEYPDGEVVCYAYNPAGLVEAVVGDEVYVRRVDYDAQGRITSIEYGNGIRTTKSYDALRLLTLRTNGGAFQDFSYEYDAAGNITKLVDHLHGAEKTFGYDNLNRLTYAAGPYGIQYYAYDEIGNLICKDGINYEYGQAGEKPHAVTAGSDGFTAGYDPNGNMIWRRDHNGVTSYTYDFEDRLVGVEREGRSVVEFVYDGAGGRVKKITPLVSRIYIGNLYEVDNLGRTAKHVFLGTQRIATVEDGSTHFYHTDHLGSANAVTDERGNLVQLIEHEPFGSIAVSSGSGEVRYRFMGRESDDETGLVYFGARYYDPVLGRFITADPLVQSLEDPQLLNRYTFCRNNPLVFQEAQGNFFWAAVAIVSIAVTVASFVSPSFNAWMHRTFGDFAAPIQTAAMVVSTFAIAGPVLSVQSAGATFAEAVAAAQVPATAAAAATAVLDTGEGRQFISWLANEVFDDAFGMSPKVAYVSASVVAHAGTSCAFESMFTKMFAPKGPLRRAGEASQTEVEEFAKTHPGGTAGGRPYVEPDISRLGERPGKWTRLVNESGEVAAYHWSGPIWDVPILRRVVKHHQFYAPGMSQGFVPASWSYGTFGVCQQLTPKGYSSSIVSLGLADTGVFVTSLVYGQYGGGLLSRIYWAQEAASD